ncbi:MAG TPA: glutamate mutase L [Aggregatilineales bacterium]|nr:glutamate mutase L [Anaerolineales bacterium]HRE47209.1 glutamate mutase L [Aggregatilineales bacterium]
MTTALRARKANTSTTGAILAADVGSAHTRVMLFDVVENAYRLTARAQVLTTANAPIGDVGVGLRRALDEMTSQTGRYFMDAENNLLLRGTRDGSGARSFLATASAGRPMRVMLVGLTPDLSLASAVKVLRGTYAEVVETLSLDDLRSAETQLNMILRREPDVIFIVGGTNGGAVAPVYNLLQTVRYAVLLAPDPKPTVLYAGNESLHQDVVETLSGECRLFLARNVRPNLTMEVLEPAVLELAIAYGEYRAAGVGGFEELKDLSDVGVLPTAQAVGNVLRLLGEQPENPNGALYLDVGSAMTTVIAGFKGRVHTAIRPDLGIGASISEAVRAIGVANLNRWLGTELTSTAFTDIALNRLLHPATIPQTRREMDVDFAFAREALRQTVIAARPEWGIGGDVLVAGMPIIAGGGVLAMGDNPHLGALLILDALGAVGVFPLRLDPYGVMPALGAMAYTDTAAAVQLLDSNALLSGTAICPDGRPTGGTAMEILIKYANGREVNRAIPAGAVRVIALPVGQKAKITVKLSRGLTLDGRRRVTFETEGGVLGLICDGRGRPLTLPRDDTKREALLSAWYNGVAQAMG